MFRSRTQKEDAGMTGNVIKRHLAIRPSPPPMIQSEALDAIVTGMLGIAGMCRFEKHQGVAK